MAKARMSIDEDREAVDRGPNAYVGSGTLNMRQEPDTLSSALKSMMKRALFLIEFPWSLSSYILCLRSQPASACRSSPVLAQFRPLRQHWSLLAGSPQLLMMGVYLLSSTVWNASRLVGTGMSNAQAEPNALPSDGLTGCEGRIAPEA
ncbi:unnamed protein product [Rhizoctonia solani]|uniref:Uncharacterized protein n=1 Tax=Rhizoctonia solani TaxID=456999 RepID=A0A8H2WAF7_9AGAM|nr:unnamed protein product [Rhizoctonia solani]